MLFRSIGITPALTTSRLHISDTSLNINGATVQMINLGNIAGPSVYFLQMQTNGIDTFLFASDGSFKFTNSGGEMNGASGIRYQIDGRSNVNQTAEYSFLTVGNTNNTQTITGGYATQRFNYFVQPTITAASSLTISTEATTLKILGAPISAGSALITNSIADRKSTRLNSSHRT